MNELEAALLEAAGAAPSKGPCDCNEASDSLATSGEIPGLQELEAQLAGFDSGDLGGEDVPDLAALEAQLAAFDDSGIAGEPAELGSLISLAQIHPGLKITISF